MAHFHTRLRLLSGLGVLSESGLSPCQGWPPSHGCSQGLGFPSSLGCSPGLGGFRLLCAAHDRHSKWRSRCSPGLGGFRLLFTAARSLFKVEVPLGEIDVDVLSDVRFGMLRGLLGVSALHAFQHPFLCTSGL